MPRRCSPDSSSRFLYLVYIVGWALINPKIAPKYRKRRSRCADWVRKFQAGCIRATCWSGSFARSFAPARPPASTIDGRAIALPARSWTNLLAALFPLILCAVTLWGIWWYVVIHPLADVEPAKHVAVATTAAQPAPRTPAPAQDASDGGEAAGARQRLGRDGDAGARRRKPEGAAGDGQPRTARSRGRPPRRKRARRPSSSPISGSSLRRPSLVLLWYYWKMEAEQFELLKLLISSVMPLGILTFVVLAVILFGITTATESAAIGAAGAFLMGFQAKTLDWERIKQSVFLTAKTTAMVCWLFVGSALFSGVFAILGGQQLVEQWVLSFNLSPRAVHDPVAGDHLRARLAARMDRDHRHLRADLPAAAQALQHRPDPLGHAGVRQPAGGVPVAAGRDVGVLPEGRVAHRT